VQENEREKGEGDSRRDCLLDDCPMNIWHYSSLLKILECLPLPPTLRFDTEREGEKAGEREREREREMDLRQ